MNRYVTVEALIIILIACTQKETSEPGSTPCPTISQALVPAIVQTAFSTKYPADTVITWFRKDSIGYCAYFIKQPAQKTLAEFSNDGSFVMQEIDTNQNVNYEDSAGQTKGSSGCECDIPE